MKYKQDKGFTLVEVMVALAVVAIVTTSLFQMFVTTSYVNHDAKLTDLGNIIAVSQSETFKANPLIYDSTSKYYNSLGTLLTTPESGGIPTGAVIKVESTVTPTNLAVNSSGYFPNFAGIIDLSPYIYIDTDPVTGLDIDKGCDIQITSTNEIKVGFHGAVLTSLASQDSSNLKNNILPIQVSFTSGSTPSRMINLINNSTVEVDIYFFTQVSNNPAQSVTLSPVSGYSSLTNVLLTSSANTEYNLQLSVFKLIGDVSQFMFTYSAGKYIYQ